MKYLMFGFSLRYMEQVRFRFFPALAVMIMLSCLTACVSRVEKSFPAVLFLKKDMETITGLNLDKLKDVLVNFVKDSKGKYGIPGLDSLEGVWLFDYQSRDEAEGIYYRKSELIGKGKPVPNAQQIWRNYHHDIQFVWDFNQLILGDWAFSFRDKREVRCYFASWVKDAQGKSNRVELTVSIDVTGEYKVLTSRIDETVIYPPMH